MGQTNTSSTSSLGPSSTSTESLPLHVCDMCKEALVPRSRSRSWLAIIFTLLNLALFGVSAFVFISNLRSDHTRNTLLKQTSFYRTVLSRVLPDVLDPLTIKQHRSLTSLIYHCTPPRPTAPSSPETRPPFSVNHPVTRPSQPGSVSHRSRYS